MRPRQHPSSNSRHHPNCGDRRAVWASLGRAVLLSGIVTGLLGIVGVGPLIGVLRALHLGCSETRLDGHSGWICPDGIAYAIPGLIFLSAIASVALTIFVWREFRNADAVSRAHAGAVLSAMAAVPLIVQVVVTVPSGFSGAVDPAMIGMGLAVCAAGIAVLVSQRRSRVWFVISCTVAAVLALATAPGAFMVAPVLVCLVGALTAAVVLALT